MPDERKKRRTFTSEQKVGILRQPLLDHTPVSGLCDQHGLRPNPPAGGQKQFFENGAAAFERRAGPPGRETSESSPKTGPA